MVHEDIINGEYQNAEGRLDLAKDLLIDKATQGSIKLFATDTLQNHDIEKPTKVPPKFLRLSEYREDDEVGFFHGDEGYFDIVVDFDDLCREFWPEESAISDNVSQPASPELTRLSLEPITDPRVGPMRSRPKARRRPGAGRPREYNWPGFAVELVRRLRAGVLPTRKSECEAQMLEWCSENWPREPAPSMVREWVKAFYDEFVQNHGVDRPSED